MAYPSAQNTGFPVFQPRGPPIRGQGIPPGNMMPPKPTQGMNTPGMFAPTNGQVGQASFGNGPQPPSVQNMRQPGPPSNSINGLSQQSIPPTNQNNTPPYHYAGPSASSQRFPGPRTGVGPPMTGPPSGPVPNGPISQGPPITGPSSSTSYNPGPPPGALPAGQQYRPPPRPGGIPGVSVPPQMQPVGPRFRPSGPLQRPVAPAIGDSRTNNLPPSSASSQQDSGVHPNELPVPFHGQGQYSHQIGADMRLSTPFTPSNSEPTSRKSSRAPSPINSPTYDALEGQFTANSQGSIPGYGSPSPSGMVPPSGSPVGQGPPQQDPSQRPGITGRRLYPQSPSQPMSGQFGGSVTPQQFGGPQGQQQFNTAPGQQFSGPQGQQQQFSALPGQQTGGPTGQKQFRGPSGSQQFGHPGQSQFGGPPGQQVTGPPGQQQFTGPPGQQQFGGPGNQQLNRPPGQQHFSGPQGQHFGGPPNQQHFGGPPNQQQLGDRAGQQTFSGPGQQQFGAPSAPPSGVPQGFQSGLPQSRYPPSSAQPPAGPGQGSQLGAPQSGFPVPPAGPGQGSQLGTPQTGFPVPQVGQGYSNNYTGGMAAGFGQMSLQDNARPFNLLQERQLLPPTGPEVPKPNLQHDFKNVNCSTEVFRCTLTSVPQTSSLLNKARLPLGILIHPFKDLSQLPVIQSSVIVRCRSCRTYINPFVNFVDSRRWKCNLCYRVNDIPDEFSFDPISKTYGEPQRRPEVRSSTIEFIAPSEYMLRPPQPAVYLFLLDVSFNAIETGYLSVFCETLLDELDKLPGDARTHIGFVAFDRAVHFFNLAEGLSQPQLLTVSDIEDIFLPSPDNLLVNIHESKELVIDLLNQLPTLFEDNQETGNALGAALQAAYKMMSATGGRVTVVQTCLPTAGPGALQPREDPSLRKSKDVQNVGPATDFYKKLSLEYSAQQIAVDLFLLNGQYADIGTLACISKYSSGCIYSYPSFHSTRNPTQRDRLETDLRRYLTRKIGFEAVMRIRCTKGLSIHTFHGNFFVRSTDLLSLPNINPDAGFGMQMSIEDSLTEVSTVCFQAALLYTSSKGERRIRVHTMCLPVTNQLSEVFSGADQQTIIGLLSKMAADRTVTASLNEAREAMINAALDSVTSYGNTLTASQRAGNLLSSYSLRLLPLYILALLKSPPFRVGSVTALDDRVIALERCKTLPLSRLVQMIHPDLYPVHALTDENGLTVNDTVIAQPPLLQLCSGNLDRHGAFLLDTGDNLYMLVGSAISDQFCADVFDRPNFMSLEDGVHDLPELENPTSERLRIFVNYLMDQRPQGATFTVLRDDSKERGLFFQHLVEDRTESTMSYYEFLQYLQKQLKA